MFTPVAPAVGPLAHFMGPPGSSSGLADAFGAHPASPAGLILRSGRASPIGHVGSGTRPPPQGEALRALIQDRQREVSDLHALEVAGLEQQLQAQQLALRDAAQQQQALATDFAFNLSLIAERDAELSAFEVAFGDLRQELHARDGALSASLQQCATLQDALAAAEQQAAAKQQSERARAKQARQQLEDAAWSGDAAARAERDKAEAARQALAAALEERDALVARERAEVARQRDARSRALLSFLSPISAVASVRRDNFKGVGSHPLTLSLSL